MTLPAVGLSPSPPPAPQTTSVSHGLSAASPTLRTGATSLSPAPTAARRHSIDTTLSPSPPTARRHSNKNTASPAQRRHSVDTAISSPPLQPLEKCSHRRNSVQTAGRTQADFCRNEMATDTTHYGYGCDVCGVQPVEGALYLSRDLAQDFAACQTCYDSIDTYIIPLAGPFHTYTDALRCFFNNIDTDGDEVISRDEVTRDCW